MNERNWNWGSRRKNKRCNRATKASKSYWKCSRTREWVSADSHSFLIYISSILAGFFLQSICKKIVILLLITSALKSYTTKSGKEEERLMMHQMQALAQKQVNTPHLHTRLHPLFFFFSFHFFTPLFTHKSHAIETCLLKRQILYLIYEI